MTGNEYDIGDLVRVRAVFSIGGVGTNPTAAAVTVKSPSGVVTNPAAASDGAGSYHADVNVTEAGEWFYRFSGTGAAQAAAEGSFFVRKSRVL